MSKVRKISRIESKEQQPIEYKIFDFEMKNFSQDEKFFYFEGYLSTFGNIDRGGDVVEKGAFVETLKEHIPPLFWSHKSDAPLGVFDSLLEDDKGLYVKARMPLADDFVKKRIIPQMEIGSIKSMSIGYSIMGEDGVDFVDGVRILKKLFLWEGSLVTIPMNDQANLKTKAAVSFQSDAPIAERQRPWDKVAALGRVRDWAGVDDGGIEDPEIQEKYSKAFLWYDEFDPDLLDAYKLPIGDIINGELTIVPRAVFAATLSIKSFMVYIPSNDKPKVLNTIEKYYEKIGLESPFKSISDNIFRIDDFNGLDVRAMEKLFRGGFCTSKKMSKALVSFVKAGLAREVKDHNQREAEKNEWSDALKSIKELNIQVNGE